MVIFHDPPPWLAAAPGQAHKPSRSALGEDRVSSTTPRAKDGNNKGDEDGETPVSVMNQSKRYYDNAAKYFYAQEMLRGRFAVVQGKLRFDLAPGTNVAIRNSEPLFLNNDQLSQNGVASVIRVGIVMNAESGQAGTSFQLEHVRTAKENEDPRTSIEAHPLYTTKYTGAPLLHDYLFKE
jgi:hypothetical protein